MTHASRAAHARRRAQSALEGYDADFPVPSYLALLGGFALMAAGLAAAARASGRRLPERPRAGDLALLGVATHKASRLITKDWVTSPLRAPFTKYQGTTGAGELSETSRGEGVRRAVGDLLTCPFCTGAWVAGVFSFGLVLAPRLTRFAAGMLAVETLSDWLHLGYEGAKTAALKS